MPNFIKVGPLPPHQERALHMLDSVDYAANAGVVPAIAAIGDKDVFFQAHVIMGEAMAKEGLEMVNLISPGTGHVIDPVTHREQMRRIGEYADKGLDHAPRELRFVTWTLKYNRCHWLELLGLKEHYERAEIAARVTEDGAVEVTEPKNITDFAIHPPMLRAHNSKVRIGQFEFTSAAQEPVAQIRIARRKMGFTAATQTCCLAAASAPACKVRLTMRSPRRSSACAAPASRGTRAVGAWADASLRRFAYEWARYMRGDLPVKNDTEVTEADVRTKNLILFGDPGSNAWIRKALPKLPVSWSRDEVPLGRERHSAKDHAPALICASPLSGAATTTSCSTAANLSRKGICRVQLPAFSPAIGRSSTCCPIRKIGALTLACLQKILSKRDFSTSGGACPITSPPP